MPIEFRDYYAILGVEETAPGEEIRSNFRRLARRFHPDVNHDDPVAEEQFKVVNEAYTVLSDPVKRDKYDRLGVDWEKKEREQATVAATREFDFEFSGTGFSNFFEEHFGTKRDKDNPGTSSFREPETKGGPRRGPDIHADLMLTEKEAREGTLKPVAVRVKVVCRFCRGRGCERCRDKGKVIRQFRFEVSVPSGIKSGTRLRLRGKGEKGAVDGEPGDVYLKVHVMGAPEYREDAGEMTYDLDLAPWEAVLGNSITIPTPLGEKSIRVPSGIQSGKRLRMAGHGHLQPDGSRGDLVVVCNVRIPTKMTRGEHKLWREIAESTRFRPREGGD